MAKYFKSCANKKEEVSPQLDNKLDDSVCQYQCMASLQNKPMIYQAYWQNNHKLLSLFLENMHLDLLLLVLGETCKMILSMIARKLNYTKHVFAAVRLTSLVCKISYLIQWLFSLVDCGLKLSLNFSVFFLPC